MFGERQNAVHPISRIMHVPIPSPRLNRKTLHQPHPATYSSRLFVFRLTFPFHAEQGCTML